MLVCSLVSDCCLTDFLTDNAIFRRSLYYLFLKNPYKVILHYLWKFSIYPLWKSKFFLLTLTQDDCFIIVIWSLHFLYITAWSYSEKSTRLKFGMLFYREDLSAFNKQPEILTKSKATSFHFEVFETNGNYRLSFTTLMQP